jgi:3-oxoadipate enol-lactonase
MKFAAVSDGIGLAIEDEGEGPPIVFSHCLGGSRDTWAAQRRIFAKSHRCVSYDLRGQGDSPLGPSPVTMERLARDVIDLMDTLGMRRAVFVGISMGGMVGQHLATMIPDRLAGVVLADSAPGFDAAGRAAWNDRIAQVGRDGLPALVDIMMGRWFTGDFRRRHPEIVAPAADRLASAPLEGYLASCAAIRDHDFEARLGEIRCPTLVMCGELDPSTPLVLSQRLAAGIPGARLAVLPGVHHLPCIECPEAFAAVLSGFLEEIGYH